MTPERKRALQWFHDRGDVTSFRDAPFTFQMVMNMERDGQVEWRQPGNPIWSLTDKGRRMLHGDAA